MKTLITGAIALGIALSISSPAHAVPSGDNVLRGWCTTTRTTSCVEYANDDDGVAFRDRHGRLTHPRSPRAALTYLRHHAKPCRQEDSARCYWDAGHRGNGVGNSFMVTGGRAEGTGTVFYLYLA